MATRKSAPRGDAAIDELVYEHVLALTAAVVARDFEHRGVLIVRVAEALAQGGLRPPASLAGK